MERFRMLADLEGATSIPEEKAMPRAFVALQQGMQAFRWILQTTTASDSSTTKNNQIFYSSHICWTVLKDVIGSKGQIGRTHGPHLGFSALHAVGCEIFSLACLHWCPPGSETAVHHLPPPPVCQLYHRKGSRTQLWLTLIVCPPDVRTIASPPPSHKALARTKICQIRHFLAKMNI